MAPPTVFFHVQHLLGIGHDRRARRLATALAQAGARVVLARGGPPLPGEAPLAGVETVDLPWARAANATFTTLLDEHGRKIDDAWRRRRAEASLNAFKRCRPDILLLESFPFARRAFAFELIGLLEAAREVGALTATSVRDILVTKSDPARLEWMAAMAETWIDLVLVHGDPALVPFARTFPLAQRIEERIRATGYVAAPPTPERPGRDGAGEVIVSVGGGAVGYGLLAAALAARALRPRGAGVWRLLAGPDLGEADLARLQARARAEAGAGEVIVERARPDFPDLLRRCRLSISQAGYNTILDILQAGCRAVVVPFAAAGETEQALRARLLEERGRLLVVDEAGVTPERLAEAVARALAAPPPPRLDLALDGAATSARLLLGAWRERR